MPTSSSLRLTVADSFWGRFKGLMLTARLASDQALVITRCASVHTCFMHYVLDLVYLDRHGVAIRLAPGVKPWRMNWGGAGAAHVLEMAAGGIAHHSIKLGDEFAITFTKNSHATRASL